MTGVAGSLPVAVDVYVRPDQLAGALDEHVRELRALATEGTLEAVDVHSWPSRVPVQSPAADAVERFREFRAWADDRGVSIQPPFSVHAVASEFTGERRTYLSTPVCCLAVSAGGALAGVYPHTDDEEHYSVADGVEAVVAGDLSVGPGDGSVALQAALAAAGAEDAEDAEGAAGAVAGCPECGGAVANVQGLRACADCRWVDRTHAAARRPLVRR